MKMLPRTPPKALPQSWRPGSPSLSLRHPGLAVLAFFAFCIVAYAVHGGDPDPTYFLRRGTVLHVAEKGMIQVRASVPEAERRRSAESVERFFKERKWTIRDEEEGTVGSFRCLEVEREEGTLLLSGLFEPASDAERTLRAGMEVGEYLRAERKDPPVRIIKRRKERPSTLRSEPDGKEMVLVREDYLVFGQGLDPADDNFNPHFFERTASATPRILPFYIDRTEVTNAEYYRFCRRTHHPLPGEWKGSFPADRGDEPFLYARFADAQAYASWADKRLPTEFEWELAARGGLRGQEDEAASPPSYPVRDTETCNTAEAWTGKTPSPISVRALKDRSPLGIVGLCGNAPEWTSSYYVPYPGHRFRASNGRLLRVLRGGAYYLPLEQARAEARRGASPDGPVRAGFRLVMSPP